MPPETNQQLKERMKDSWSYYTRRAEYDYYFNIVASLEKIHEREPQLLIDIYWNLFHRSEYAFALRAELELYRKHHALRIVHNDLKTNYKIIAKTL